MKKVYNLRVECNAPTFVMTDEEFCKGLEEGVADGFGEEIKYVKLKAEPCDKDQQLAIYKRALELASKPRNDWGCTDREYNNYKYDTYYDYYLDQAKKELEEQDVTNN